jgi:Uncharacterized protein conserved in bacteria
MKLAEWQIVEISHDRLLTWLDAQHGAIRTIVGTRRDDELRVQPQAGRWSALQHLAHIARMHEIYLARIERMLTEDGPALAAYRAEQDDEWPGWERLPVGEIVQRLHERRTELAARLRTFSNDQWTRVGRHSNLGALTLAEWIEFFLVHEGHHLYTALALARTEVYPPNQE